MLLDASAADAPCQRETIARASRPVRGAGYGLPLLLFCLLLPLRAAHGAESLPPLGADLSQTSVSGVSSGAYMAGQIELAHSRQIVGAGIVAGGPFGCAESSGERLFPFWPTAVMENAELALYGCMQVSWGKPDPEGLVARARSLAKHGKIDPLGGLADDKVYLFSGNQDETVLRPVVEAAKSFYQDAGVPADHIQLIERDGGHGLLTESNGKPCTVTDTPYIEACHYDQAKELLDWIYGSLAAPAPSAAGRFIVFDQTAYAAPEAKLADEGVVYVPPACAEAAGCRIHIALHGCKQGRELIGDAFVRETGFAEMADQNKLIILFPQVKTSSLNPDGCWDWWGYTGLDFLTADAPQIAAVWAMAKQLAAPR